MRLESVIGRHYGRPTHNELIIEVSLVCVVGYDNKTRITISYPNRFSYTACSIFHSDGNTSLLWRPERRRDICLCDCLTVSLMDSNMRLSLGRLDRGIFSLKNKREKTKTRRKIRKWLSSTCRNIKLL